MKLKLDFICKDDSNILVISTHDSVFFIDLYYQHLTFSDRGYFILPGEQIKLKVIGKQTKPLNIKDIKIYSLNDYLND